MDRTQLLQHFDTLAETPEAVEKLRKLVLDFAIRGRLVQQNPKDDPATQLVERAKAVLVKERKKTNGHNNGEQAVLPFSLPKSWCWTCLDELGNTAPKNELDDKTEVGFSPMRLVNAKFGEPISFERKAWSEVRKGFTHFADGDVVVAKITPCFQNGKSGVIRGAPNGFGAGTTELHVLRPVANCVLPEYALIFVKSPHFLNNGEAHMTGTAGQKRVSWDYFARTPFPLPPLAEQRRIVAKVEELLALCDELEARQTAAREHRTRLVRSALDHLTTAQNKSDFKKHSVFCLQHSELLFDSVSALRQAILSLAIRGRLVPQNPKDEPASILLEETRILFQQLVTQGKLRKPEPLPPVQTQDQSFCLPDQWAWCRLGELIRISSGDGLTADKMNKAGNIPVYGGNGINGHHDKWNVEKPTIAIGRVGFYCGSVHETPNRAWVTDNAFVTTFAEDHVDRRFLYWLLKGTDLAKNDNATAQPVISGAKVYPIAIGLPPLAEQQRIVAKVDELLRWCDALEARLTAARTTATHLLDATLHQVLTTE